jgi:ABC-2 type transport system permease protein
VEITGNESDGTAKYAYYSRNTGDMYVNSLLESVLSDIVVSSRLASRGLDAAEVRSMMQSVSLSLFEISETGGESREADGVQSYLMALLIPVCFAMMIYMTVLLYGQMIGRSVVEEKSSKIVDVLLSSLKPSELMMGKIFGVGLAGLLQYAVWIGFALAGILVIGPVFNFTIPVQLSLANFVYLLIFFLLGYLLFGACYAAIGSASEDEQHMGQLSMPFIILLIIPIMMITSIVQNPQSGIAMVFSLFPLTAPICMLARATTGSVPFWQIAASIALLAGTIVLVIMLAAKIFRTGILMNGKSFSFKDIATWLRA